MPLRKELREFGRAVTAMVSFVVLLGLLYPLLITGLGQAAFPGNANGRLVYSHGRLIGSKLIGQSFASPVYRNGRPEISGGVAVTAPDPRYFQTRPSGTTPADNAAATSFANYGPNSTVTERAIAADIAAYIALNGRYYPGGLSAAQVPVDAADTSASGIDPDISVANARIPAPTLPPDSTSTVVPSIGPGSRSASSAATPTAPAPSTTSLERSSRNTIASAT